MLLHTNILLSLPNKSFYLHYHITQRNSLLKGRGSSLSQKWVLHDKSFRRLFCFLWHRGSILQKQVKTKLLKMLLLSSINFSVKKKVLETSAFSVGKKKICTYLWVERTISVASSIWLLRVEGINIRPERKKGLVQVSFPSTTPQRHGPAGSSQIKSAFQWDLALWKKNCFSVIES